MRKSGDGYSYESVMDCLCELCPYFYCLDSTDNIHITMTNKIHQPAAMYKKENLKSINKSQKH